MKFSTYIKNKRLKLGKSLRSMAKELGITPSYLSDMERDNRTAPSLDKLTDMRNALDLSGEEWYKLLDLAAESKNDIPEDIRLMILQNKEVIPKLRDYLNNVEFEKPKKEE